MKEDQETGWEVSLPKFLFNPVVWIATLAIIGLAGYAIANRPLPQTNTEGDPAFKALCIKEKGESAWMEMKPMRNGKVLSNQACWGCMVDDNTMFCNKSEYEAFTSPKTLGYFKKVSDTPITLDDKPYFLYVGAQFCPFCAAERWSLVKALSNFGTWSDLGPDTSADEEAGFSEIPTYDFVNATYISDYISFRHKETADRNGKPIPGQELTNFEEKWFNQYDPRGGVPFLFMNGKYVQLSSGFSPGLLSGKTYEQVKADVDGNANTPYVAAINKEADIITAYLCKATGNKPNEVCSKPEIASLVAQVP